MIGSGSNRALLSMQKKEELMTTYPKIRIAGRDVLRRLHVRVVAIVARRGTLFRFRPSGINGGIELERRQRLAWHALIPFARYVDLGGCVLYERGRIKRAGRNGG